MAKKKVSNANHAKPSQKQDETVKSHSVDSPPPPPSVDSEKLESLKSLNQMLLKETVERRQEVDSLLQSKGSLEADLSRSNSEKAALDSELAQLVERVAELELERRVVGVYVAVQVGVEGEEIIREMKGLEMEIREKEREVEERASTIARLNGALSESEGALRAEREASKRVRVERDVFEAKLNRQIEEDLGLRANLSELGDKIRELEREIEESRTAYNAVASEKEGAVRAEREASKRVRVERDVFEAKLNRQIQEDLGLRANMAELGDKIRDLEREIEESRTTYNAVMSEKEGALRAEREASKRVCVERNVFEAKLNQQIEEDLGLRENLAELGGKIRNLEREIEESRTSYDAVVSEKEGALRAEREASKRVCVERDVFEAKLNRQIEEDSGLRANLAELGDKIRDLERKIEESRTAYNAVVSEKEGMATRIELLMREKDLSVRDLMESNKLIEKMKDEMSVIVREKEGVEKEKNGEIAKRCELENVVSGLNEMVAGLKKEEAKLQKFVAELDRKCAEGETKLSEMLEETDRLVGEVKLSEKRIKELAGEKGVVEKELNDALKNLAERSLELEGLANEKIVILEDKSSLEGQVRELGSHVDELRAALATLEGSNVAHVDKIRSLESQVGEFKCKLEKVYVERKGVERCLDEEKQKVLKLKAKIEELEKRIEKSNKASAEVKTEKAAILSEKVKLESRCGTLRKEIASLQGTMAKLQAEFDSLKSKAKTADANSDLVLKMLKGTSEFCSKEKCDDEVGNLRANGQALKVHAVEMEKIKNAFKSKAAKVEEMKRQLEVLRSSVMDEQKKKSFWTMLSSATTLLAALSLAYVARGH